MAELETADTVGVLPETTPETEKQCRMHSAAWITIGVAALAGLASVLMLRNVLRRNTAAE